MPRRARRSSAAVYAGTMLALENRAHPQVVALGGAQDLGHRFANQGALGAGPAQHRRHNVRVQHPLHGDAVGGGFQSRHAADAMDQRFAVMRAGAPHQRAVDIEENQCAIGQK